MLNLDKLKKYDISGMYKVYDRWPEIARKSYKSNEDVIDLGDDIDHIVFAGMGGSGAIGDILSAILSKTDIHLAVVKGYNLPNTVDSKTLVITTSVSGDTVETLTVLRSAKKTRCNLIAFSSGGKMESICVSIQNRWNDSRRKCARSLRAVGAWRWKYGLRNSTRSHVAG